MVFCEICEIFRNIFFTEHLPWLLPGIGIHDKNISREKYDLYWSGRDHTHRASWSYKLVSVGFSVCAEMSGLSFFFPYRHMTESD